MFSSFDNSYFNPNSAEVQEFSAQQPGGCYVAQKSKGYFERIEAQHKKQKIKPHSVLPPRWDNSFDFEKPILGVASICFIICYFISLYLRWIEFSKLTIFCGVCLLVLYIYDCSTNGVGAYINNRMTPDQFIKYIEELKQKNMKIIYRVKAYHNQRSHSYSTKKGTKETVKRVDTFKQDFELPLTNQEDITLPVADVLAKWKQIRVHTSMNYSYGNEESQKCLEDLRWYAEIKASTKDKLYDAEEIVEKPDMKRCILVIDPSEKVNKIFSSLAYTFYCVLGLSLLYRVFINKRIPYLQHQMHKKVYSDQIHCIQQYDIQDSQSLLKQDNNLNEGLSQQQGEHTEEIQSEQGTENSLGEKVKQN